MTCSPEDFPQLWQKPAFNVLFDCLQQLRVDPPVWNFKISRAEIQREQDTTVQLRRQVSSYLSNIIKSNLDWIEDEDLKEELWTEASKRLSERCGRAAMGEIIRRWPFEGSHGASFELAIREPPLTGDSLGLKTWGSSYLLALMLGQFAETSMRHLLAADRATGPATALELGSGTGLLGLATAAIWKTTVVLSDLPAIMSNLAFNMHQNRQIIESLGGQVDSGALTWGGDEDEIDQGLFHKKHGYKIVLAADPLYDDDHPELLAGAIHDQLCLEADARALVMVPRRDETTVGLLKKFKKIMEEQIAALICVEEGIVPGQDDWEEDEDTPQVECWWGVFKRDLA